MDGSSFGNPGEAGFGGVFRDHLGRWKSGFVGSIGLGSNLLAELQAIKNGLQLGWEFGDRRIICETDSLEAIELIDKANMNLHSYARVIMGIMRLLKFEWQVELRYTLREANQVADYLTKMGARSSHTCLVLDRPPTDVSQLLLADSLSIAFVGV